MTNLSSAEQIIMDLLDERGPIDYWGLDVRSQQAAEGLESQGLVVISRPPPFTGGLRMVSKNDSA